MPPRRSRTTITYYDRVEFEGIAASPAMQRMMRQLCNDIANDARPDAPISIGPGHADGEHARNTMRGDTRLTSRGWEGRVGWPRSAYYLLMHEKGWVHKGARPFLRPAVERHRSS